MEQPRVPVGFDYAKALLEIRSKKTYAQIAEFCGYASPNAVGRIIGGVTPSHPHGEAIYVLYRELFGSKPPMNPEQQIGVIASGGNRDRL